MTFIRATLAPLLLSLAVLLTTLGGWMDMTGRKKILGISKKHAWHDGLFLVLLTIAFLLYK